MKYFKFVPAIIFVIIVFAFLIPKLVANLDTQYRDFYELDGTMIVVEYSITRGGCRIVTDTGNVYKFIMVNYNDLENYLSVGDKIIKAKEDLNFYVIKQGGERKGFKYIVRYVFDTNPN